jgi:hypothetical protein
LSRPRPDSEDLRYALVWRREGCALAVVAEALEVPELTLRLALGDPFSEPRRRKNWTRSEDGLLIREYAEGDTGLLARRLGRSPQAVRNRTNKLGLRKTAAWHRRQKALVWESEKMRKSRGAGLRNAVSLRESNNDPKEHGG